ncbi:MAG: asparagine synthase-related protein [archaeon]
MPKENIFRKFNVSDFKNEIPKKASLKNLRNALVNAIATQTKGSNKAAVLFSGGLDSSLVSLLVSKKIKIRLFVVGTKNSSALPRARKYSNDLGLDLHEKIVSGDEVKKESNRISKIIGTKNKLQISIALPIYFALSEIKKSGLNTVFCGQGADELFFGYDEFRRLLNSGKDYPQLEDLRWAKLINLWKDNLKRDISLADYFGLELKAPYLEKEFMLQALAFNAKQNIASKNDFLRKRILRRLALELNLPKKIALERKKAVQYDSGISKILKNSY